MKVKFYDYVYKKENGISDYTNSFLNGHAS